MGQLVCARFSKGPRCSDKRLETTDAEQEDCFTRARITCTAELNRCLSDLYNRLRCNSSANNEERLPNCIDHLSCVSNECRQNIADCFCTGMQGMTCTFCPDELDITPEEEEDETVTPKRVVKNVSLTLSSLDIPIPIAFGKVIVGGNIIWVGNERSESRTTSTTSGTEVTFTTQQYGFVDIAIGLCAGEIEAIGRVWVADTLVVDNRIEFANEDHTTLHRDYYDLGLNTELHVGSEAQKLFSNMASDVGFGRTPAHRGLAVLMLKSFPVFVSNAQMPVIRVEVISRIDREVAAFSTTSIGTLDDASLSVDPVSARALVGDTATDGLSVVDIETMAEVNSITADDPIEPETAFQSPTGDILFRHGTSARYVFGYQHSNYVDVASVPDITPVGDWASLIVHDVDVQPHTLVTFAKDNDITYYEVGFEENTFTLEHTHTLTGTYKRVLIDDYKFPTSPSVNRMLVAFAQDSDDILINFRALDSRNNLDFYEADAPIFETLMPGSMRGGLSVSFVDAFSDVDANGVIIHADTDGVPVLYQLTMSPNPEFGWQAVMPEAPENFGSKLKFRPGISREYTYIVPSGDIYRLAMDTGIIDLVGNLDDYAAPAITGPQYYDAAKGFILYHANGDLVKLYPSRYAGADATVADIIQRIALEAGIDAAYIDTSAVTAITMQGYLIQDQATGLAALKSLMDFFHLSGADSGGKLTFRPLSTVSTITVDDDNARGDEVIRAALDVDNVGSVEIKYYDTDRLGAAFTQVVTRDFMEEYDDFISNVQSYQYGAEVFTTGDVARLSGERTLMKLLQRQDRMEVYAAPRQLLIEPGDFVNGYRVDRVEIDVSYEVHVLAKSERADIYDFTPALDGVSPPIADNSQTDFDAPIRSFPIGFQVPPLMDDPPNEIMYTGLTNPDSATAETLSIYTKGPTLSYNDNGPTTGEAVVGRLVSFPATTNRFYTTDKEGSFVIEFNDTIPVGVLDSPIDINEIYTSYTKNALFIGKEVVQYQNASVAMDGRTVTFTGLVRGRFGTDEYVNTHVVNEVCGVYSSTRMVAGKLGWDAVDYGVAFAAIYDSREPAIRREVEVPFVGQIARKWSIGCIKMLKKQTGAASTRGLYFRASPRLAFKNTFFDEGEQVEPFNDGKIGIAILSAPYDPVTFETEFAQADTYPIDFEQNDIHTNTYIKHVFTNISETDDMVDGFQYRQAEMIEDGVDYTDDIYVAVFNLGDQVIESAILGVHFPGSFPYLTFEVGHG